MARPISQTAVALAKLFEGYSLKSYRCPAGLWTIGYGHTAGVKEGDCITSSQAENLLYDDLANAGAVVERAVTVPLNDNQFAALVDFVFNVGAGNFMGSTLLGMLNKGWYQQVPFQLERWNHINGVVSAGLTRRRAAEAELWRRA